MNISRPLTLLARMLLLGLSWLVPVIAQVNQPLPQAIVSPASFYRFPGGNHPDAGIYDAIDSNSPLHWDTRGNLYLFSSVRFPYRSSGRDLFQLHSPMLSAQRVTIRPRPGATDVRDYWLEATYRDMSGLLYGWYHFERKANCPDPRLYVPQIGALVSADEGMTWQDLGTVMSADENQTDCQTGNYYFPNGNGDFSVILDEEKRFFYFFFGSYVNDVTQQGICVARMAYADRDNPVGKVWKYRQGAWREPGINGATTPVFPVLKDWHSPTPDALWGPSVHYNTYLQTYVMVTNHAINDVWGQEGIYISYNRNPALANGWSMPLRLPLDPQGRAYPQLVGLKAGETDKLAGQMTRLFLLGQSYWEVQFKRSEEAVPRVALPFSAPTRFIKATTALPRRR